LTIDELLVHDRDSLDAALDAIERNGLGLAFAIDAAGCITGRIGAEEIAARLAAGGNLRDSVASAIAPGETLHTTRAADPGHDGLSEVTPVVDDQGRPVSYVSPGYPKKIPVAEPCLSGNELKYVTECVTTNWISSQGAFVPRFEAEFAARLGVPHAVACSNGTAALHLALLALGIGAGDEVILPDLTFAATINTVIHAGATPVIVDVDKASWNIDPAAIEAALTPLTRAIMPVHLYGQPADMDPILAIAKRRGLVVIEDAAEAMGSADKGRPCGAMGEAGAFSFFSNKLITTGEGGMVVFRDAMAAARARRLRDHGMDPGKRYWHIDVGYNYRLTNLQAAIGCAQLEQMDRFLARKLEIAERYRDRLGHLPGMTLPAVLAGAANSFWAFSIVPDMKRLGISRDDFMARLGRAGIETRPLFYPLHAMPPYRAFAGNRAFPNTSWLSENGVSLPSAVTLTDAQIDYICGVIERLHVVRNLARTAVRA
jgi:perosamine synthetase